MLITGHIKLHKWCIVKEIDIIIRSLGQLYHCLLFVKAYLLRLDIVVTL